LSYGANNSGSSTLAADGAVGPSGKPIRLFNVNFLCGLATNLVLRGGTGATDDIYVQVLGTASDFKVVNFNGGLLFPDGCFFDKGTTLGAVFQYRVEF
jgi:hypothetical protein